MERKKKHTPVTPKGSAEFLCRIDWSHPTLGLVRGPHRGCQRPLRGQLSVRIVNFIILLSLSKTRSLRPLIKVGGDE